MARANWSTGYFQAEVYRALLVELGHNVSVPSELELGPNQFYTALAEGDADFWVNSWYPGHISWHQNELTDGLRECVGIVGHHRMARLRNDRKTTVGQYVIHHPIRDIR